MALIHPAQAVPAVSQGESIVKFPKPTLVTGVRC